MWHVKEQESMEPSESCSLLWLLEHGTWGMRSLAGKQASLAPLNFTWCCRHWWLLWNEPLSKQNPFREFLEILPRTFLSWVENAWEGVVRTCQEGMFLCLLSQHLPSWITSSQESVPSEGGATVTHTWCACTAQTQFLLPAASCPYPLSAHTFLLLHLAQPCPLEVLCYHITSFP